MTISNFVLLSIVYFFGSSTALSWGVGYYTIYRPLISGMLSGLILGDAVVGMMAGAIVNIIYIDFVSTGGSLKGDQCLTGIMAAVFAIMFKMSPVEASAIAYPIGFAGVLIWKYRLNINTRFVRAFENKMENGQRPNIFMYNVVLPQLLLYFMSTIVIGIVLATVILGKTYLLEHEVIIKQILFFAGIFLISVSVVDVLYRIKSKATISVFVVTLLIVYFLKVDAILFSSILLICISIALYKENLYHKTEKVIVYKKNETLLNKKDLIISWSVWMNFSHACYNYERMQGMAFAHSMKNIIKKLYDDEDKISQIIHRYTEFFNTEPNMATPLLGSVIAMEEEQSLGILNVDISYIKNGMMGVAAGLGDSITQVVITPLFISIAVILSLDHEFALSLIPLLILAITILYISYKGWMNGYYRGKESLLIRVKRIKNSRIKLYFSLIFPCLLGVMISKIIAINYENIIEGLVGVCALVAYYVACKILIPNKFKGKYTIVMGYVISAAIVFIL